MREISFRGFSPRFITTSLRFGKSHEKLSVSLALSLDTPFPGTLLIRTAQAL
jgi:hypothetical protein